jgi:GNAT superfamily N-acetyltransferase
MLWRLSRSEFERNKGEGNRRAMHNLVESGKAPGILGYHDTEPVSWCALAPRECYPALGRSGVLKPVDDLPVWSISCLFVRKDYRRKGLSIQLLRAAAEYVKSQGGTWVEGYPVEPKSETVPAPFAWTGLASAFLKAGFHECARQAPSPPIMRLLITLIRKRRRGSQ